MFSPEFVTSTAVSAGTLVLGLRLNWYRPLPLSCVEALTVTVEDALLPSGLLLLDGTTYDVATLGYQEVVWWRSGSDAELLIPWPGQVGPTEVRVTMRTRIPLFVDPTGAAVVVADTAVVAVTA